MKIKSGILYAFTLFKNLSFLLLIITIPAILSCCSISPTINSSESTAVPSNPSDVTGSFSSGFEAISWKDAAGATSYNIYYSTNYGVTVALAKAGGLNGWPAGYRVLDASGKSASALIGALMGPNTYTYYFIITASNSSGESASSSQASIAVPVLAAPDNVTSSYDPVNGNITVNFTAVPGAVSYNLYYSSTPGFAITAATEGGLNGVGTGWDSNITTTNYTTPDGSFPRTPNIFFVITSMGALGETTATSTEEELNVID